MKVKINIKEIKAKPRVNKLQINKVLLRNKSIKLNIKKDQKQRCDKKTIIFSQFKQKNQRYHLNLEK